MCARFRIGHIGPLSDTSLRHDCPYTEHPEHTLPGNLPSFIACLGFGVFQRSC